MRCVSCRKRCPAPSDRHFEVAVVCSVLGRLGSFCYPFGDSGWYIPRAVLLCVPVAFFVPPKGGTEIVRGHVLVADVCDFRSGRPIHVLPLDDFQALSGPGAQAGASL